MNTKKVLHGIIPPMITPLLGNDTLDADGLKKLIDRMISGGVHGMFVLGTTGEAPSLTYRLRREVLARASEFIAGRVPMLAGVTDTSFDESVALAQVAKEYGAAAAVVAPPYYFEACGEDLKRYYAEMAKALPIPMILYHMPGLTKVKFTHDLIRFAVETPEIIALKDSSGDLDFFWRSCKIAAKRPDFPIFVGPEHLLEPAIRLGGSGGVNGGANIWPELFVEMYNEVTSETPNLVRIDELQAKIDRLNDIYAVAAGGMGVCRGIKYACKYLNVCSDLCAEPFHPLKDDEKRKIEAIVDELGIRAF